MSISSFNFILLLRTETNFTCYKTAGVLDGLLSLHPDIIQIYSAIINLSKNMLNRIKEYFGTRKCTGLLINCPEDEIVNIPSKKLRFCEAVNYSFELPFLIHERNINCIGAARNLGFQTIKDDEICLHISENTGIKQQFVQRMLANTPSIITSLNNVYMGITEEMEDIYKPDFFIVYANPDKVMQLIHKLARNKQIQPFISTYSLFSICGNVFARGYNTGAICISFGCPESIKYGGVAKDEVIVGFPEKLTWELFE